MCALGWQPREWSEGENSRIWDITHLEPPLLPYSSHISPPQAETGKGLPEGDYIPKCPTNSHPTKEMSAVVGALIKTAKTKFNTNRTRRHWGKRRPTTTLIVCFSSLHSRLRKKLHAREQISYAATEQRMQWVMHIPQLPGSLERKTNNKALWS